jgi:hypothetical protein
MSGITFFAFTILKIFPLMKLKFELYGCLLFFAGICVGGAVITVLFIPETKGKNLIAESSNENDFMLDTIEKKIQILPTQKT